MCEALTTRTGKARSHNAVHDDPARNVFQLFGQVLAKTPQAAAALGAIIVAGGQLNFHARDMIGGEPLSAIGPRTMASAALGFVFWFFVGKTQLCRHLGNSDLAGFQRQLKLFDALR